MGTYFKSKIEPYFHRNVERFPYAEKSNIRVLCDYYRVSPLYITLSNHGEVDWMGIFFWTKVNSNIHIFSGGRFGYAGFFPENVSCPISEYLPLIDNWLKRENISSCSLSFLFTQNEVYDKSHKDWIIKEIDYLVAITAESVINDQLILPGSKKRNILRNLNKAENNQLQFEMTSAKHALRAWYNNCHLVRIAELSGKKWNYELLSCLLDEGTGKLALVRSKYGEVLGGCFVILSNEILELFMMSTPRKNFNSCVNFFLTKHLYMYAWRKKIKYVNWQSSNPPKGGLANFKKGFNAQKMSFLLFNKVKDKSIKIKDLIRMYRDFFVFPINDK
tara:strand:+ start:914 stop:1909 length:996 start_codon:yes stop_codon:yes gene_type:complete